MVPDIHDPTSMLISKLEFVASYKIFQAENHLHIEIKLVGTGKKSVAMATKCFIALGVFSIELLTCQVSVICAANGPR